MLYTVEDDTDYAARHAGPPATVTHASGLFWSGGIYSRSVRKR